MAWYDVFNQLGGQATAPNVSGPGQPPSNGFNWASLIPTAASVGGSLLGSTIQNKQAQAVPMAQLAQQKQQFDQQMAMKQSEMARRNMLSSAAAPALLRDLGYRDPGQIAQLQQQFGQQQSLNGGGSGAFASPSNGQGYRPAPTQGSKASLGVGLAGGLGGIAAGAAFGGPIGAAVAGAGMLGSAVASKIGAGRRAANSFVQSVENPFGQQDLPQVVKLMEQGQTDQAKQLFTQAYGSYKQAVNEQMGKGGNEAKVAQQSMSNPKLQQTIQTIAQQLGVQI